MTSSLSLTAAHVGMHHFADDGAGADDGDLDDDVVEAARRVVGEGSHLRAAFDLEHSDGVGVAESLVDEGIFGQGSEIDLGVVVPRNEFERVFEDGHHAEAEEINFDEAEVGAVFLVPLHDGAAGHGCALDGDDAVEHASADDHAAGVLAEMAGQVARFGTELEVFGDAGMAHVEAGIVEVFVHGVVGAAPLPVADEAGEFGELLFSKPRALPTSRAADRPR